MPDWVDDETVSELAAEARKPVTVSRNALIAKEIEDNDAGQASQKFNLAHSREDIYCILSKWVINECAYVGTASSVSL